MASRKYTPIQIPLPIEGETVQIQLTQGCVATIDAIDADLLEFMWYTQNPRRRPYAARQEYRDSKNKRQKTTLLHCVIAERMIGRPLTKQDQVDHWDGDSLNDRRGNLRLTDVFGNAQNRKRQNNNTSGFKGVSYKPENRNWVARITVNGKRISLGSFPTPEIAYEAYCKAAIELHKEFARLK